MTNPDFSIITTLYKTENLLPRLVDCVLMQTHPSWELIILADGPHPITRERVDQIRERSGFGDRISYEERLRHTDTYGNALRGYGLEVARGRYVCWAGHDCLLYHNYLATHWELLQQEDALSVVHINYWKVPENDFLYGGRFPKVHPSVAVSSQIDLTCYAAPLTAAKAVNAFDEGMRYAYNADYITFERLRAHLPLVVSERTCAAHF